MAAPVGLALCLVLYPFVVEMQRVTRPVVASANRLWLMGSPGVALWREMVWRRIRLAASCLLLVLMLAGCATVATGSGQDPNPPYQQSEPRDTSGMH
jgi:predicted small secreted protein